MVPLKIYLVAGEASGDRLGAALMQGLKTVHTGPIEFYGVGGPLMAAKGLTSLFPMRELSIFGILEVLPKLRGLFRRRDETAADILQKQPDAVVTIDSPGFCMRLAAKIRAQFKGPIIHYVAPSVWAWKPGRAVKMARHVDHVLALLPFEPPYMHAAGMSCDFVGHPVVAEDPVSDAEIVAFREKHGFGDAPLVTLLPGSRNSEISRLAPIFLAGAERISANHPDIRFVIPIAAAHLKAPLQEALNTAGVVATLLSFDDPRQKNVAFAASVAALAASGTVSVELAKAGTPMVIGYKTNWLTAWIMRRAMLAPSFTLVNLLTDSKAVPEFEPRTCTVDNLTTAMEELLGSEDGRVTQIAAGQAAMVALGQRGKDPGIRAAISVLAQLDK